MTGNIIRTPAADDDLFDIWLFIAQDNEAAATRTLEKIKKSLDRLVRQPRGGRDRSELALGLRSFAIRPYVIFYRVIDDDIELVRVLHGARDIEDIFGVTK